MCVAAAAAAAFTRACSGLRTVYTPALTGKALPSLTTLYTNEECQRRGDWMRTTCRVVTQSRPDRGSNSRPLDHKSDALPLRNHATSPALMCLEHVLYPSGRRGGGCGRRRRREDGATVGPNDVSDLYTPNGVMAHRHLFYLYNVFYVDTILNILYFNYCICIAITSELLSPRDWQKTPAYSPDAGAQSVSYIGKSKARYKPSQNPCNGQRARVKAASRTRSDVNDAR